MLHFMNVCFIGIVITVHSFIKAQFLIHDDVGNFQNVN